MSTTSRTGAVLCLLSATGFGVSALFAKQAYAAGVTVPAMLTLRFVMAAALFWAIVAVRRPRLPRGRTLLICIGLGGIGYALQAGCYFGALQFIDGSLTGLLLYLYPALVTGLAIVLRRERPQRRGTIALASSAAGLLLVLGTGGGGKPVAVIGVLLAIGAAVTYALYLTVAAAVPADLDVFALSAVVCTSAAVTMETATLVTGTAQAPGRPIGWLWIALLAIFSTVVPIALMLAGMRLVGAPTASILSCFEPAVTVLTTAVVYGERLTPGQAVGGAVILAAVVILAAPRRRTSTKEESPADVTVVDAVVEERPHIIRSAT
ncbi:DMT family transporter [Hamadaea tsunoensis]|uniref:DMT family transporter n=1 Tax=Hamadaea tsunoensis TaxID=53368 RepID=UPI00041FA16F|nr:DMT family transporter [Hamadaea tsunoensis]